MVVPSGWPMSLLSVAESSDPFELSGLLISCLHYFFSCSPNFFSSFMSRCSHTQVLGTTFVHEFHIFCSQIEVD